MVASKTGTLPVFSSFLVGTAIGLSSVGDSADHTSRTRSHIHANHTRNEVSQSAATIGVLEGKDVFKRPAERTSPPKSTVPINAAAFWPTWLIAFFAMFRKKPEQTTAYTHPPQKHRPSSPSLQVAQSGSDTGRRSDSTAAHPVFPEDVRRHHSHVTAPSAFGGTTPSLIEIMTQERARQLTIKNGNNTVTILNHPEDLTEENLKLQLPDRSTGLFVIVKCENESHELRLSDGGSHDAMVFDGEKILARGITTHESLRTIISLVGIYQVGKK